MAGAGPVAIVSQSGSGRMSRFTTYSELVEVGVVVRGEPGHTGVLVDDDPVRVAVRTLGPGVHVVLVVVAAGGELAFPVLELPSGEVGLSVRPGVPATAGGVPHTGPGGVRRARVRAPG